MLNVIYFILLIEKIALVTFLIMVLAICYYFFKKNNNDSDLTRYNKFCYDPNSSTNNNNSKDKVDY